MPRPSTALAWLAPALTIAVILATAGSTLGYDFHAYRDAAVRLLDGRPLYDPAAAFAGPAGLFLYPPPFALAMVPFAFLPESLATVLWTALLVAALVGATLLAPVSPRTRRAVLLLAALDWPLLYAVKLGQVGPLLLLLFAAAWRTAARGEQLGIGVAAALGALVKVQPGLVLAVAVARRAWRVVAAGIAVLAAGSVLAALVAPPGSWPAWFALVGRVARPAETPHAVSPGAVAVYLGAPLDVADAIQLASLAATLGVVAVAAVRCRWESAIVVAAVASQLLSPIAWDHYAIVLLLPTALLLDAGVRAAILLPLATSLPLVLLGLAPPPVYAIVLAIGLVWPVLPRPGERLPGPAATRLPASPRGEGDGDPVLSSGT